MTARRRWSAEHRTTLVFVNTRRQAERVAHALGERMGEGAVLPHHGSLSRRLRLEAEQRLKRGELRAVVATASLELGIDIGTVDLVCQMGSPRSISVALQRIGRAGHWVGAKPKGRIFATTRDELIESAAVIRSIKRGELDRLEIPRAPLDILAQQIVAMAACDDWDEDELFAFVRRAYPYRRAGAAGFRCGGRDALGRHGDVARAARGVPASRSGESPAARTARGSADGDHQWRGDSG